VCLCPVRCLHLPFQRSLLVAGGMPWVLLLLLGWGVRVLLLLLLGP
jgi:hypothetical protein